MVRMYAAGSPEICVMVIIIIAVISIAPYLTDKREQRFSRSRKNIIIHSFYKALFSALEQTHCVHVACDSE